MAFGLPALKHANVLKQRAVHLTSRGAKTSGTCLILTTASSRRAQA